MANHAKPLSRRTLRKRSRRQRIVIAVSGLLACASCACFALNTTGTPTAAALPQRVAANTPSHVIEEEAASRSAKREPLLETVRVDTTTGKWTLGDSVQIDVADVDKPMEVEDSQGHELQASQDTVDIVNDTSAESVDTSVIPVSTGDTGNAYPWGQCTWWAYERRHQLGLPVGSHFGNAGMWASSAASLGYVVDHVPSVGAVVVFAPGQAGADGYYGHVAVVEQVHDDGSITISESNAQGLGVISNRRLDGVSAFWFVH